MEPENPYAKVIESYKFITVADAQFWRAGHDHHPALCVTLPQLGWEFRNDDYVGMDPEGEFCYNDFSQIPQDARATCLVETKKSTSGQVYVNIKFHGKDGSICGEFFALDRRIAAEASGIVGEVKVGRWKTRDIGSTTAHVKKRKGESRVTLIGTASPWKAEFDVDGDLVQLDVNVGGELRWTDEERVKKGLWVRWDSDHLVFYENDWNSKNYTAYFMPPSDPQVAGELPLGHIDQAFPNVKWSFVHHAA